MLSSVPATTKVGVLSFSSLELTNIDPTGSHCDNRCNKVEGGNRSSNTPKPSLSADKVSRASSTLDTVTFVNIPTICCTCVKSGTVRASARPPRTEYGVGKSFDPSSLFPFLRYCIVVKKGPTVDHCVSSKDVAGLTSTKPFTRSCFRRTTDGASTPPKLSPMTKTSRFSSLLTISSSKNLQAVLVNSVKELRSLPSIVIRHSSNFSDKSPNCCEALMP
mmetsp:Transcript_124/g.227  ORF Transcript_124/g.227 Transcript_124/m.227 type:complete len:219 (+) Transcript_124:672-1328(+)